MPGMVLVDARIGEGWLRGLSCGCVLGKLRKELPRIRQGHTQRLPDRSKQCSVGRPCGCVDDITPARGRKTEAFGALQDAPTGDCMVLHDAKQQVLGLTRAIRRAWEATGGAAVSTADDLGASDDGYKDAHPGAEIARLQCATQRIQAVHIKPSATLPGLCGSEGASTERSARPAIRADAARSVHRDGRRRRAKA